MFHQSVYSGLVDCSNIVPSIPSLAVSISELGKPGPTLTSVFRVICILTPGENAAVVGVGVGVDGVGVIVGVGGGTGVGVGVG